MNNIYIIQVVPFNSPLTRGCVAINHGGASSTISNEVGNKNLYCDNFTINVGNKFSKFILRHSLGGAGDGVEFHISLLPFSPRRNKNPHAPASPCRNCCHVPIFCWEHSADTIAPSFLFAYLHIGNANNISLYRHVFFRIVAYLARVHI